MLLQLVGCHPCLLIHSLFVHSFVHSSIHSVPAILLALGSSEICLTLLEHCKGKTGMMVDIVNLLESGIVQETSLWALLGGIVSIRLIEQVRPTLDMGGTILWAGIPNCLRWRKLAAS